MVLHGDHAEQFHVQQSKLNDLKLCADLRTNAHIQLKLNVL